MLLNFKQGIVFGSRFLRRNKYDVDLIVSPSPLCVTISHGTKDYYHIEAVTVNSAWKLTQRTKQAFLYIDIDMQTGERTFGYTTHRPVYGPTAPANPVEGLHWFDTTNLIMKHYTLLPLPANHCFSCGNVNAPQPGQWNEAIRVFVGEYS